MIDWITDPWTIALARWTMCEISSALLQIGFGYVGWIYCWLCVGRK